MHCGEIGEAEQVAVNSAGPASVSFPFWLFPAHSDIFHATFAWHFIQLRFSSLTPTMQTLLNWGLANSNPEDLRRAQNEPREPLDPGIIDAILGKPDSVLMRVGYTISTRASR